MLNTLKYKQLMNLVYQSLSAVDIYWVNKVISCPKNYAFTGEFRPPVNNEHYLTGKKLENKFSVDHLKDGQVYPNIPRLIVTPIKISTTLNLSNFKSVGMDNLGNAYPVNSIYKGDILNAPKGFFFTKEFRIPKQSEKFLNVDGVSVMSIFDNKKLLTVPRLIMESLV